jgi:hypothetical protein
MRRIVYLTFYFKPDLCAGSFRNSPLALELARQSKLKKIQVDIYTTLPNRYSSFNIEAPEYEEFENIRIFRVKLPVHRGGMRDQIISFSAYYRHVLRLNKGVKADLIFASSSRLFTAFLGYQLSKRSNSKLVLDIRDIFVDTIKDVVKSSTAKLLLLPFLRYVERITFSKANHINLISGGFEPYFKKFNCQSTSFFTNGIDEEFLVGTSDIEKEFKQSPVRKIVYAGNIGEGQGLHRIIPEAARLGRGLIEFIIIGDGGAKNLLEDAINELDIKNVKLLPPMARTSLINEYENADYLFIHLNDYKAFEKVLPSKLFELATFRKFILAGVSGFSRHFIESEVKHSYVFCPCDANALVNFVKYHSMPVRIDRSIFIDRYKRESINQEFAKTIINFT